MQPDPCGHHCQRCTELQSDLDRSNNLRWFGWFAQPANWKPSPPARARQLRLVMDQAIRRERRGPLIVRVPAQRSPTAARDETRLFDVSQFHRGLRITQSGDIR